MKYKVRVQETLVRHMVVEAENSDDAERKIQEAYDNGWITLDYNDYDEYSVECEGPANKVHIELYEEWE